MNSVIIINKEKNMTSRDVVNKLCKLLHTKKIGHTGTLDPLATGVLVVCTGRYTKLVDELTSLDKEYVAKIKLGIETDTLDITGNVIKESNVIPLIDEVKNVLKSFLGKSIQEVPKYSAIKINGKKLYEYAREGIEIELPKHEIEVFDIDLIDYINDEITFKVHVSKGTYIRSLIRDICYKLNTVGTMSSLERTKQGKFKIENSFTLKDVEESNYKFLTLCDIFDYPKYELNDGEYNKVKNGNSLKCNLPDGKVILYYNNEEIAIYEVNKKIMKIITMIKI
jgi:tRNA pseudouridine55 synthase